MSDLKVLRVPDVVKKTGLCRAKIYKMHRSGDFPQKIQFGGAVGFIESEIDAWILSKQESRAVDSEKTDGA